MLDEKYVDKLNEAIINNILTDSLFNARKKTGDTADEIEAGTMKIVSENVLEKEFPPYMDYIGGGNNIVDKAVEKAIDDTTDFFFNQTLSEIDNKIIKIN